MPLSAEQHNVIDPPARLFHMRASMLGIQAQGYHRYVEQSATMRVKAAALVPVVTAEGQEMTRGETVTLFDDMCVMAPATLIDPAIVWEEIDPHAVQARVATAGHTVSAELSFNDAGELAHFVSDDRSRVLPDGTFRPLRWSTPIARYGTYGAFHLPSAGEARWHESSGAHAYIELTFDQVQYNVGASMATRLKEPSDVDR